MTSRPRREWKSFLWVPRWSVRLRMRSDRIATCTSGEPVSPAFIAYSPMSACLRSGVIDIGLCPSTIDDAHRLEAAGLDPRQGDDQMVAAHPDQRTVRDPVDRRLRRDPLAMA